MLAAATACTVEPAEDATSVAEQGIVLKCDGHVAWQRHWFVDGVEVGNQTCMCDGSLWQAGSLGTTSTYSNVWFCPGDPCDAAWAGDPPTSPPPDCP